MNFESKVKFFIHKVLHWEYWPTWIIYFPCFIIYPYYAFRTKSTLFFTVANPGIENSGAFLSSKFDIYKKLQDELIPKTLLVNKSTTFNDCQTFMMENQLSFPIITKPDLGLRGLGIKMIESKQMLNQFLESNNQDYLFQEFINYKNEIGIFLIRESDDNYKITSIVDREFVMVKGDGTSSIKDLLLANPRYAMQFDWLKSQAQIALSKILPNGEILEFAKIGNHSKGTVFKNGSYLNNEKLQNVMQNAVSTFPGFNYGRLDIKYNDYEELLNGENFKIIELNGVFSEPAHIYDPEFKLFEAWKVLLQHFNRLYQISVRSIKEGQSPMSFFQGITKINKHFKITSELKF